MVATGETEGLAEWIIDKHMSCFYCNLRRKTSQGKILYRWPEMMFELGPRVDWREGIN